MAIPTKIELTRRNVADLIEAWLRAKFKSQGIENMDIRIQYPFTDMEAVAHITPKVTKATGSNGKS